MAAVWAALLLVCWGFGSACDRPTSDSAAATVPTKTTGDIFTRPVVLQIEIEIPRSGMSVLRRTQWGESEERPAAKATVREGGVVYHNVAVHLKGAAGSFRPVDDRPALTLNFDKFVPGQSFHGMHKISLNNSVQDPSLMSEKICRELFDAAGVPVPRAGHAFVKLNGRSLGLYVLLEGANRQFLKRYFSNTKGNLFDGGFVRDVSESLSVNAGDNPNDRSGLIALVAALRQTRQSNSLAPLERALDVDRFISMIALEIIIGHWDGYALNKNNWRIFHDLDSNRMVFIPHGVDQTFGVGQQRDTSLMAPMQGVVAAAVMRTAEGRRRYRERIGQLYTNVFRTDEICARVDEIEAAVQPVLAAWDPFAARTQVHQAAGFKQRVVHRGQELQRQLGRPVQPLKFGSDNVLRLSGWKPSAVRSGNPVLAESKDAQGRPMLGVSAGNGLSSGSWRTRATVSGGAYRLEGKVRVSGVEVDPGDARGGAGLRVSRGTMPRKLAGSCDWQDFAYEFTIEDEAADVEFICELRALRGQAWFDAASLRLVRVR